MTSRAMLFILSCNLLFFSGCFKRYKVSSSTFAEVQRIPSGFPLGSSFTILPLKNDNPLFAKEVTQKIERLLKDLRYTIKDKNYSDFYLVFDHDMKNEKQTTTSLKYLPGTTKTTQGNVYGSGGWAQYSGQTNSLGSFTYVPEEIIVYTGVVHLYVYDASKYRSWLGKKEELIWQGSAASSGENGDLRELIDYLLVSAFSNFGVNTKKIVSTEIWESDAKIQRLRNPTEKSVEIVPDDILKRALENQQ